MAHSGGKWTPNGAEPNRVHKAIAELEKMGKLDCVITQNIDNLHQKAGNSPEQVFELHGNMNRAKCLACGGGYPIEYALEQLKDIGEPQCMLCSGMLKPDVVFFGESLPQAVLREATQRSGSSDLFIVIGSSLAVYPAAYMPLYAREAGADLVIINADADFLRSACRHCRQCRGWRRNGSRYSRK